MKLIKFLIYFFDFSFKKFYQNLIFYYFKNHKIIKFNLKYYFFMILLNLLILIDILKEIHYL